jgi:hypothetical protein
MQTRLCKDPAIAELSCGLPNSLDELQHHATIRFQLALF